MSSKVAAPKDPFDAVEEVFTRFAETPQKHGDPEFWKQAAQRDYRTEAFHSNMESKDVRVLVKALSKE